MSDKTCLIFQPGGLGDVLFLQKITKIYKNLGYQVIHPVLQEYAWLNDYLSDATYVGVFDLPNNVNCFTPDYLNSTDFPYKAAYDPANESIIDGDFCFLNFFKMPPGPIMETKYTMWGMGWEDWADHIFFKRNMVKENDLFYRVLNLRDGEPYAFVNYMCQPKHIARRYHSHIDVPENQKQIHLDYIPGFSLFDWCKVIENAESIHMVETSLNCMMESPQMRDIIKAKKEIHLYSRNNNFWEVRALYKLPWNYHA